MSRSWPSLPVLWLLFAGCSGTGDEGDATESTTATSSTSSQSASSDGTSTSAPTTDGTSTSASSTSASSTSASTSITTGSETTTLDTTTGGPVECGGWFPQFPGGAAYTPGADLALGDLDMDGAIDCVVVSDTGARIDLNDGVGGFDASTPLSWKGVPGTTDNTRGSDVSVGDLDGDGWDDIVVLGVLGEVIVWTNPGRSQAPFGDPVVLAKPTFVSPAGMLPQDGRTRLVDVDGDGDLDLLAALTVLPGDGALAIYLNDGAGGLTPPSAGVDVGASAAYMLTPLDLHGDGGLDVIVTLASYTAPGDIVVLLADGVVMGEPTFAAPVVLASGVRAPWVGVGDLDADGDQDVVYTDYNTNLLKVLTNAGDGTLTESASYPTEPEPTGMAIVDVDLDCQLDVVTGSYSSVEGHGVLFLNVGDGTFTATTFQQGAPARNLFVADLSLDGYPDVVLHNPKIGHRVLIGGP